MENARTNAQAALKKSLDGQSDNSSQPASISSTAGSVRDTERVKHSRGAAS